MKIVGLDLSLTGTGWAFHTPGEEVVFGTISSKPQEDIVRRLCDIEAAILGGPAFLANFVAIEGLSFGSKGAAVHHLAALHFFVRRALMERHIPCIVVAPNALKKFTTGKHLAPKEQMMLAVFQRWGHVARDNNQADGIALLYVALAMQRMWEPTTEAQREVIAVLEGGKPAKKKRGKAA